MKVFLNLIYFTLGLLISEAKLPSAFKTCKRNDPNLDDCFAKATEHALPLLQDYYKELGIPSLDPLVIDKIRIDAGSVGSVNLTQIFNNINILNVTKSKILKSKITRDELKFHTEVHVFNEQLPVEYDYELDGRILLLPISGKGKAHIKFYDINIEVTMLGNLIRKKGLTYAAVQDVLLKFSPKFLHLQLDNLFNGNEQLGKEMNRLFNENWKDLLEEYRPAYEQALGLFFKSIFSAVYKRFPVDELFPLE